MNTNPKKIVAESVAEKTHSSGAIDQLNESCSRPRPVNTFGVSGLKAFVVLGMVISLFGVAGAAYSAILAFDTANLPAYTPQPNHNWSVINGGYGYNPWTGLNDIPLGTGVDGGTYMSGAGSDSRQADGDWSFGLYAYGTGFDI